MSFTKPIHFLAGFVFALVDTDQFLPELNPFTFNSLVGADTVFRLYSFGFFCYFCWPIYKYLRYCDLRWWQPAAVGIGAFCIYAFARLIFDGYYLKNSLDIRNVMMLGLLAGAVANPLSWKGWLKPFACGMAVAFAIRAVCHFTGQRQDTAAMIGADSLGFYGTFSIHCDLLVTVGVIAAIWFTETRQRLLMIGSIICTVVFLAVVTSGFRRGSIIQAALVPIFAVCIAYWLLRQTGRGVSIALTVALISATCISLVAVAFFGTGVAWDRLQSVMQPNDRASAMESNLSYMGDWDALAEVIQRSPWGVGFGNSYGVTRYLEDTIRGTDIDEFEPPLHVGPLDLVARAGPFGAWALLGLIWTTVRALLWMRGKLTREAAMIAGASASFFLMLLLMPLAPLTGQLKVMATYGIALGVILQLAVRTQRERASRAHPERPLSLSAVS